MSCALCLRGPGLAYIGVTIMVLFAGADRPLLAADLTGTWTGHWCSQTNGHNGPMKARFKRINGAEYRVRFTGLFCKVIPFYYSETFQVVRDDGQTVELSANSKLCFFGTFHCRAAANGCQFNANYAAENDQGYFKLQRTGN
jgi:hypothetical protein